MRNLMVFLRYFLIALLSVVLTACGSGSADVGISVGLNGEFDVGIVDVHTIVETHTVVDTHNAPYLKAINIYDSYGYKTTPINTSVAQLNPYIDEGVFEINWKVDSAYDYVVELYINDYADITGATKVDTQICGIYESCDKSGFQFCEYTPNAGIVCDGNQHLNFIDQHIYRLPQSAYFFVQVCDIDYYQCEYDYIPIILE